ncbi:hypothetical protein D9619_002326 [Psilocybe cf. subviscida]|uniref:Uncharacterized protein n=1 Tax=Psilocybe cf. subviscida TaxID=2480587 RepID=A0A8H5AWT1_9AGAR|nr:hypothetical protein D9619_002326 [Psilocybe cf. subviscida]
MSILTRLKLAGVVLLRIFTVYDGISSLLAAESLAVSEELSTSVLAIIERRKRMVGLIVPMLFWHGYNHRFIPTSWCVCTLYIAQMLGGINPITIEKETRALGSVLFSIINAICTLSTYGLYFIAVLQSTASWLQAVVQLLLLVLPDVVGVGRNVGQAVAHLKKDEPGTLDTVITARSIPRNMDTSSA